MSRQIQHTYSLSVPSCSHLYVNASSAFPMYDKIVYSNAVFLHTFTRSLPFALSVCSSPFHFHLLLCTIVFSSPLSFLMSHPHTHTHTYTHHTHAHIHMHAVHYKRKGFLVSHKDEDDKRAIFPILKEMMGLDHVISVVRIKERRSGSGSGTESGSAAGADAMYVM